MTIKISEQVALLGSRPWRELTFVAFDTETSGKYPLTAEICEIAAVKWQGGREIETFSTLIKPSRPMGDEVIRIHGITNEMVSNAPPIADKIGEFHKFIQGAVLVAHHAPFDLGFLAIEFENANLLLPEFPVLCSSLLSRRLFPESENHRLQTLIKFFNLHQGQAHRATDDARACLEVGLRCLEKLGGLSELKSAYDAQGGALTWQRFSMRDLTENSALRNLIAASRESRDVEMVYSAGSSPGKARMIRPEGVVRSLDGDYVVAYDVADQRSKRYLLEKIVSVK